MSVAEFYHDHYRDVRRRLMGKPVREVLEKLPPLDGPLEVIRESHIVEVKRKATTAEQQAETIRRAIAVFGHSPTTNNQSIISAVARKHGFKYKDIAFPSSRNRKIILAKREAIHAIRLANPGKSLPSIGRLFSMDHSTIIHHLRMPCPSNVYRPNAEMPDWEALANPAQSSPHTEG